MNEEWLNSIQSELKKRHQFPYRWYRKQNDQWDRMSGFIYTIKLWDALTETITFHTKKHQLPSDEFFQYAANRWYNFHSAKAVEYLFAQSDKVVPVFNAKDRSKDFYLSGIPFDHKTSVFPKRLAHRFADFRQHPVQLIQWLYDNQSSQQRHHLKNRIFVIVHNAYGDHWKLKAELWLLKAAIDTYLDSFRPEQLHTLEFGNQKAQSDILWVCGNLY